MRVVMISKANRLAVMNMSAATALRGGGGGTVEGSCNGGSQSESDDIEPSTRSGGLSI